MNRAPREFAIPTITTEAVRLVTSSSDGGEAAEDFRREQPVLWTLLEMAAKVKGLQLDAVLIGAVTALRCAEAQVQLDHERTTGET